MDHLSTNEILQVVDGTLANGIRTKLSVHLESCPQCRSEVEFHRNLVRAAKSAPLARPSSGFVAAVLEIVSPRTKKSWSTKIVDNLGRILAMAMVLSVVWYVLNAPSSATSSRQLTIFSTAVNTYVEYYARAQDLISKQRTRLVGDNSRDQAPGTDHAITLTLISILILVTVDRFVVRRLIKIRT